MYGFRTHLLLGRREAGQGSSGCGEAGAFKPKRTNVLFLAIAAVFMTVSDGSAENRQGEINAINVEGGWAYTQKAITVASSTWPRPVRPRTISGFSLRAAPTTG
jgi:hypothetical protein